MAAIQYDKRYDVICRMVCDFEFEGASSKEAAHELAANHIRFEDKNGHRPNESHEVEITEVEVAYDPS